MTVMTLLEEIENGISSPWGLYKEICGDGFTAKLDLSPYNKRICILDYHFYHNTGPGSLNILLENICTRQGFTKIWGKISEADQELFLEQGFTPEASIKGYFYNHQDAVICSKFFDQRQSSGTADTNRSILQQLEDCSSAVPKNLKLPEGCSFKFAEKKDLGPLADLYRSVFPTYPYPIFDSAFLESNLKNTIYGLVYRYDKLVAAAAAEINYKLANSEMTDFASLPSERGQGLAPIILKQLEHKMAGLGINCLYTIARSTSFGMNLTFARASYKYSGTLINNCNISGGFEDMNVFYKNLSDQQ